MSKAINTPRLSVGIESTPPTKVKRRKKKVRDPNYRPPLDHPWRTKRKKKLSLTPPTDLA